MAENLWGDLKSLETTRPPVMLLREQADVLSVATDGVLIGYVDQRPSPHADRMVWLLGVRVPSLNDYETSLVTIIHPVVLYPLLNNFDHITGAAFEGIEDEAAFKLRLGTTLSGPGVRKILSALKSQAGA